MNNYGRKPRQGLRFSIQLVGQSRRLCTFIIHSSFFIIHYSLKNLSPTVFTVGDEFFKKSAVPPTIEGYFTCSVLPSSLHGNGMRPSDTTPNRVSGFGSVCPRKSIRAVSVPRFQHRRVSVSEGVRYSSSSLVYDAIS